MTELEPSYWPDPIDAIEPKESDEDAYREASRRGLRLINSVMLTLHQGQMSRVAFWQICFGLGLSICEGRSQAQVARECGVRRAAISKGAQEFRRRNGLPPSQYSKPVAASKSYSIARHKQL